MRAQPSFKRVRDLLERLAAGEGDDEAAAGSSEEKVKTKKAKAAPLTDKEDADTEKGKEKEGSGAEREEPLPKQKERVLAAARSAPVANTTQVQDFQAWITALILTQGRDHFAASADFGVTPKDAQHLSSVYPVELHNDRNAHGVPLWVALAVNLLQANKSLWHLVLAHAQGDQGPLEVGDLIKTTLFDMRPTLDPACPNRKYRAVHNQIVPSNVWEHRALLEIDLSRHVLRFAETIINFAVHATATTNLNMRYVDIGISAGGDADKGKARIPVFIPKPIRQSSSTAGPSTQRHSWPATTATTSEGLRIIDEQDVPLYDPRAPTTIPRISREIPKKRKHE
ncbi:hypothetical protein OC842_007640 [Tilletia horrida]|uniref:Uncharacterized protein n=1 Tax=Tilletia horrida TaxID=155126 RepID=A0AAN6G3S1_9BASI|nr:hypothetical protein OC842_007640 [Tilletia horrida]